MIGIVMSHSTRSGGSARARPRAARRIRRSRRRCAPRSRGCLERARASLRRPPPGGSSRPGPPWCRSDYGPKYTRVILAAVTLTGLTDAHIHVQPWWELKPEVLEVMTRGRADVDELQKIMRSPTHLLRRLDADGIERAVLVNYPSPDLMGFTHRVNEYVARILRGRARPAGPHGRRAPALHATTRRAEVRRAADMGVTRAQGASAAHGVRAQRLPARPGRAARPLRGGAAAAAAGDDPHRHLDLPGRAQPHRASRWRSTTWRWTSPTSRS